MIARLYRKAGAIGCATHWTPDAGPFATPAGFEYLGNARRMYCGARVHWESAVALCQDMEEIAQ